MDLPPPTGFYGSEPEPPARGSRARITAWIVVLIVLLAGGGAALVLRATNAEQPVEGFAPDTVAGFIKISLQPEAQQRDALRALIRRLPSDLQKQVGSKIDDLLESAAKDTGLSYKTDIKPWVGGQIGIAFLPPGGATSDNPTVQPITVALVPVKDASAAKKALDKARAKDKTNAYEIFGSIAYLSDTNAHIDSFRSAVKTGHTLADSAAYKSARDRAGPSLVFGYVDFAKILGAASTLPGDVLGGSTNLGKPGVGSFWLKASSDGFELQGRVHYTGGSRSKQGKLTLLESSPSDLLGAVSVFDLGGQFKNLMKAIQQLSSFGLGVPIADTPQPEITKGLQRFEKTLGLSIDKDLVPWLHGELTVLVGKVTAPPIPDIAILIQPTDQAALGRTMKALSANLPRLLAAVHGHLTAQADGFIVQIPSGPPIVVHRGADRVVIATNADYARRLLTAASASLGDDTVYRAAVGSTDTIGLQIFLRVDRVRPLLEGLAKLADPTAYADYETNVQGFLKPVQALAISASRDGDDAVFRFAITVSKS
jgi:hypothetical protein